MIGFDLINLFIILVIIALIAVIPVMFLYYFRRLVLSYEKRTDAMVGDEFEESDEELEEPVDMDARYQK